MTSLIIQKEIINLKTLVLKIQEAKSTQKQQSCKKKSAAFKSLGEKSCEIKGGGHEMAAMMLMIINFSNAQGHY